MDSSIDYSALPLRDIHLPEPVSWWPPALGWWVLLAVGVIGAALLFHRYYRLRRHRAALSAIERIAAELEAGATQPAESLARLSVVVRRFAMSAATAENAAIVPGLVGGRWLEYLDAQGGDGAFSEGAGRRLLDAPYLPEGAVDRHEALEVARLLAGWVRSHKAGG